MSIESDSLYKAIKIKAINVLDEKNDMIFHSKRKKVLGMCERHMNLVNGEWSYRCDEVKELVARKTPQDIALEERIQNGIKYIYNNMLFLEHDKVFYLVRKLIELMEAKASHVPSTYFGGEF